MLFSSTDGWKVYLEFRPKQFFISDLQKTLESEKKRTDKLKADLATTEEELAESKKVCWLYLILNLSISLNRKIAKSCAFGLIVWALWLFDTEYTIFFIF